MELGHHFVGLGRPVVEDPVVEGLLGEQGSGSRAVEPYKSFGDEENEGRRTIAFAHRLNCENGDETTLAKVYERFRKSLGMTLHVLVHKQPQTRLFI